MAIPIIVPIAAVAALGALIFRGKLKAAAHEINDDTQRIAANTQNAAKRALEKKPDPAEVRKTIAQAIAAGGKQDGAVVFSARDQVAMSKGIPPEFQRILDGPGEPATQATINMLKIAIDAGQAGDPRTTLKTTLGGMLFSTTAVPTDGGMPDTAMVQVEPGAFLSVDMNESGIPGGPGSTVFIVRGRPDMASNTVSAENVDPRVPTGLVMDVPFSAITGIATN